VGSQENQQTRTLDDVLAGFDVRTDPFDYHDVAEALRLLASELKASGTAASPAMYAERLAFDFTENYHGDEGFAWGTYYGPVGVATEATGKRIEWPSLQEVTGETVSYWQTRAQVARHPLLRIRYADLVWEFGRRLKLEPGPEYPRIVIDATVEAAQKTLFEHTTRGFTALRRALALALSLRDEARGLATRDALITYERRSSEDAKPGTWGAAFDELVEKAPKHLPVPPALVAEIVAELEARLERLTRPRNSGSLPDGFHVEAAALRLARYYRRIGDDPNMRRAVLTYGDAFATAANRAAPILAMAWLERVLDTYRSFGLREAAEAVEVRLRELGPEAMKDMKPISASAKVPGEVVEQFLDQVTRGPLEEVLVTLAVQFVPDKETLTNEVHELAKAAPLSMLFTQTLMDSEGRPVAKVGSVEEDLDGHVVRQTSQHLEMKIPWLHAAIERMRGRLQVSAADICAHLLNSPVFDPARAQILERGLAAYLNDDAIVAAPMLIPQVEDALRAVVRLSGGSTYKSHRLGGLMLKGFDDLLREETIVNGLGENVVHYFRVLFVDQRGWNIRNTVCHGILPPGGFRRRVTDRIVHALLVLALLRAEPKPTIPTE
jgi:hypothetical protein